MTIAVDLGRKATKTNKKTKDLEVNLAERSYKLTYNLMHDNTKNNLCTQQRL